MTDIKNTFSQWLTQAKDKYKTTPLTASEYINRLARLSQRLVDKEDFQYLSNNIYILRLLFMDSSNWININSKDLDNIVTYLYNYRRRNRNFNDHYNQFFHSLRKQLNFPLSLSSQCPKAIFDILKNTEEYVKLSDWIKYVFVTEKSLKYLSWLYIDKAEKRKIATALVKYQTFLTITHSVNDGMIYALSQHTLWLKRINKSNNSVEIDEASGVEARNFYSRYKEGKAEKLLSVQETAQAIGYSETTIRRFLKDGKLHFKQGTNKIIAENIRRFLKRKHTKRKVGLITPNDFVKNKHNWLQMKDAVTLTGHTSSYIRWQVKKGRVAYTRYGSKKFLYFKPDLLKI